MIYLAKYISVTINLDHKLVYEFMSDPTNLPKWARGLSGSINKENDHWVAVSPMGKVFVKFVEKNNFGILDHEVTLESGQTFYNPLRVIRNKDGAEVVFTLFKSPGMSDQDFNNDAEIIFKDLLKLKTILEG